MLHGPLPEDPKEGDVCPVCGNAKLEAHFYSEVLSSLSCPMNMPSYGCGYTFFVRSPEDEIRYLRAQWKKQRDKMQKMFRAVQKAMEP